MDDVEQYHDAAHQSYIKNIQVDLVTEQIAIRALDLLDDAEDGSNHDQTAGDE